ncbi:MAG: ClbS/DfsB family four-helix bundle protein, partial [Chloroflexota bacterium]|nr:ClbS/DfsB family four-helix bundle protein [Chloroflexota bacterium]
MSTMERRYTKADLINAIDESWAKLNEALDRLTPEQMTEIRDPEGWAVKDHLVHIAAWERSVVVFLQGRPRHEGLGVDEQIYDRGDDDEINAAIQEQRRDVSLSDALSELREVHAQMLRLLEPMTDDDMYKPNSDFQPHSTGERDERPIAGMIYSNTANHFAEHQE